MQKLKATEFPHISEYVLRALFQNRITTLLEFLQEDVTRLSAVTKLTVSDVLTTRNDIYKKYSSSILCGNDLIKIISTSTKAFSTGITCLDNILEGGIPCNCITELCGLANSGKTQLCLQIAINCAKSVDKSILYVDTKGDISAVRIQKILESLHYKHKDMASVMLRIKVIRVWNLDELLELLQALKNKTIDFFNLAMIIIDSLPCLMIQFLGSDNKIGLSMLNTAVNYLRYLNSEMGLYIICVNIQTRWVDQESADLEDEEDITARGMYVERKFRCLGRYWSYIPNLVLQVEESDQNQKCSIKVNLTVLKSLQLELQSRRCTLTITASGIS